jgi:hypothetical protein
MASELRRWLQKHPHPATVRGWTADDDTKNVKLGVERSKWRDAEAALADCWKLEALDAEGNVLRVCELDGATERKRGDESKTIERDIAIAKLISAAHNEGAERHSDAYRLAYEQQRLLVEVMSARLHALERAWHQLLMAQQTDADPNQGMVAALLAGAFGGAQAPAPEAPKANGKAKA